MFNNLNISETKEPGILALTYAKDYLYEHTLLSL